MCFLEKLFLLVFISRKLFLLVPWEENLVVGLLTLAPCETRGGEITLTFSGGRRQLKTQGSPLHCLANRTEHTFIRHHLGMRVKASSLAVLYFFLCSLMHQLGGVLPEHLSQEKALHLLPCSTAMAVWRGNAEVLVWRSELSLCLTISQQYRCDKINPLYQLGFSREIKPCICMRLCVIFLIWNLFIHLRGLTGPKICSEKAGDPGEPVTQFQCEGQQA